MMLWMTVGLLSGTCVGDLVLSYHAVRQGRPWDFAGHAARIAVGAVCAWWALFLGEKWERSSANDPVMIEQPQRLVRDDLLELVFACSSARHIGGAGFGGTWFLQCRCNA